MVPSALRGTPAGGVGSLADGLNCHGCRYWGQEEYQANLKRHTQKNTLFLEDAFHQNYLQYNAKIMLLSNTGKNSLYVKGIVHPKMTILCLSAYSKGIQDVGDFVSSVEHKRRFLPLQSISHIMAVNGTHGFERKKTYTDKTKLNPAARDDTLRSKDTKQLVCARNWTVLYVLPLICHTVQLSWARSQQPVHDASSSSSCFTADRRLISALLPPISQMDHWNSIYNLN